MWGLDLKEGWLPKNWCFWIVMLEKTLESPLDSKEIKPVNPKENQLWIFIGRTDAEAKTPVLWPPVQRLTHWKKTLMLGKIESRRKRGNQGWDGWMAPLTQCAWVWASSGRWWRTGKPGMLPSLESHTHKSDRTEKLKNNSKDCICFEMRWKLILSFKCIYK